MAQVEVDEINDDCGGRRKFGKAEDIALLKQVLAHEACLPMKLTFVGAEK